MEMSCMRKSVSHGACRRFGRGITFFILQLRRNILVCIRDRQQLEALIDSEITYGDFFRQAPEMNPNREKIIGVVCGVRVENIEDPLMREI